MNSITFQESGWQDLQHLTAAYYRELHYKNDSFHNGVMFGAKGYCIRQGEQVCGFLSVGESWENGMMLTAFYVLPEKRQLSPDILQKAIDELDVQSALVPSNDGHFVSVAFEKLHERKTSFEMQAYQFTYGQPSRPAEYGMECIAEVKPEHFVAVNELTEGQWEGCFDDPGFRFYALEQEGVTLGFGAIQRMPHNPGFADVGNFTVPRYRCQGVGRSLIINLSRITLQEGLTPVAGCWYGNKESILTLKSSGFLPENRIFLVKFR